MSTDSNGGPQLGLIEETLKPLIEKRKEIDKEIDGLQEQLEAKRAEKKTVDKVLRAGGLIENPFPGRLGKAGSREGPRGVSDAKLAQATSILEEHFTDREFTIKQFGEYLRSDNSTTKGAIEAMRAEGLVRLVGSKHPEGTAPHVKSAHYASITKG